jgi:hypothetical protein
MNRYLVARLSYLVGDRSRAAVGRGHEGRDYPEI